MRLVASHIFHVHCIVYKHHLAVEDSGGDMREAISSDIHKNNFVRPNLDNHRQFVNPVKLKCPKNFWFTQTRDGCRKACKCF